MGTFGKHIMIASLDVPVKFLAKGISVACPKHAYDERLFAVLTFLVIFATQITIVSDNAQGHVVFPSSVQNQIRTAQQLSSGFHSCSALIQLLQ